jgi:hypothetical protein
MLISPLLLAVLHQHQLDGARSNPIGLEDMAETIAAAFVRAFEIRPDAG